MSPLLTFLWAVWMAAGLAPALPQHAEQGGIAVDFTLTPAGVGERAVAAFRVKDASGQPLSGLRPLAWMTSAREPLSGSGADCHARARGLLDASLANRADVNLNAFLLLTLNGDRTVSFINPQVSFNSTQLESLVELPAAGAGWVLSADGGTLYVTLPEAGSVAVIDTATRRLAATLELGAGSRPTRIAVQPDGHYVWVALDGASAVAVIDTEARKAVARIGVGEGEHDFAFTAGSRLAYVTNSGSGTVTPVAVATLARLADIAVGRGRMAIAYGEKSGRVYVAGEDDAAVTVIDPDRQEAVDRILVPAGTVALRFDPEGRFAFAISKRADTVTAIDSASQAPVATSSVLAAPDQVAFSRGYAYVRGHGSPTFALFSLAELQRGRLSPVTVQAGRAEGGEEGEGGVETAAMIAPTPEGNSVLLASGTEDVAYYYAEGLMVPMGTLQTYSRKPHGLLVLDQSLREVEPGLYTATVSLPRGGGFEVPLMIDQPRVVHCFTATVPLRPGEAPAPDRVSRVVRVEPLFQGVRPAPGKPVHLSFRVLSAAGGQPVAGLADVRVLALEPPGAWQERKWAHDVGNGIYQTDWVFPRAGVYKVGVSVASRGLGMAALPFTSLQVEDPSGEKRGAR